LLLVLFSFGMKKAPVIVFLVPYPYATAPGQRFRYEQYLDSLQREGFTYQLLSFLDEPTNAILYQKGKTWAKIVGVAKGFLRRLGHLWQAKNADWVFVFREATPLGYPWVEWLLAKVWNKKMIYDFDDAIWIDASEKGKKTLITRLKYAAKVKKICAWSHKISVGNEYLGANAQQFVAERGSKAQVVLNPTTIDTLNKHNQMQAHDPKEPVVIGWTGSHSTLIYLDELVPILQDLEQVYDFTFRVICNRNPELPLRNYEFVPWNEATEISDLVQVHIGVMPLKNDAWSEGKCGFKALQYLALGIPAVVSPVGVNTKIIDGGRNGFCAQSPKEWKEALSQLLENPSLRKQVGLNGREFIERHFSVRANEANFLSLFQ
jgi:glycosyltransferase involved in cell wall biosynthesis